MNPAQRQQIILRQLEIAGATTYQDLAKATGVVEMTIRRDVDKLAARGLVYKVLGGVQIAGAPKQFYETELERRTLVNAREKAAIAEVAARSISPGLIVFLDGGTTSIALARILARDARQISVVTNSVYICQELARARNMNVIVLGGAFDPASACLVGSATEGMIRQYFVDIAFFSTPGLS